MDMAPPQAPPALIQNEAQPAIQAFETLVATYRWLEEEQREMPAAADAVAASDRQAFVNDLARFWAGNAHGLAVPRREVWASKLAVAMREAATLREHDGTLIPIAAQLARRITDTHRGAVPANLQVGELLVGETPYAGSLIALDHDQPGTVVLFTPDRGWEALASLDDVHALVEARMRQAHAAGIDITGVTRRTLHDVIDTAFIRSRAVRDGDIFDTLVSGFVRTQREQMDEAWVTHAAAASDAARDDALVDSVTGALRPDGLLDLESILAVRDTALVEAVQAERLARVPADVRNDWEQAWYGQEAVLRALGGTAEVPVASPGDFAIELLGSGLERLGINEAPGDIVVTLDASLDPTARLGSLESLFEGPKPARMRLVDLAWQNVAAFDLVRLHAADADGQTINALDDKALRALVRAADVSARYQALLTAHLRDGDDAPARKARAVALQAAWMRVQANEARLSYYLPNEPASLRFNHSERGFRWIEAVLDSPAARGRRKVEGHDVVVRHVTYRDAVLTDIVEIGAASTDSVPTIILYTPGAPDGISFREFDDRGDAARRFFYHPAFREYLLDHLPAAFAVREPSGPLRRFNVDGRAWVFGGPDVTGYTPTGEPFVESDIAGHFLEAGFDARTTLALRDMADYGRSASDANWAWLFHQATFWNTLVANVVKEAISAPFRAPGAAWRFYDSVKAGDGAQAFVDFTELYTHSLALLPYYSLGRAPIARSAMSFPGGASLVQANFRGGRGIVARQATTAPRASFERRYLANDVRKQGRLDAHGLYTIRGQRYLEHDGALYAARWDAALDTVRLRPHGASAIAYGPAVRRVADGHWAPHSVGLKGGSGRAPVAPLNNAPVAGTGNGMTPWQQATFRRNLDFELYRRMPNTVSRHDLLRQVEEGALMGRAPNLSAEHARVWADAAQAAHNTATARVPMAQPLLSGPFDLSVSRAPIAQAPRPQVPVGYRVVTPAEFPRELYLADQLPYSRSIFQREVRHTQRAGSPYVNDVATLRPSTLAQGFNGVRLTTHGPGTSAPNVARALGISPRSNTFMVRIDPHRLGPRLTGLDATLQLLELQGSHGSSYVLRSLDGRPVRIYSGEFHPPVPWR